MVAQGLLAACLVGWQPIPDRRGSTSVKSYITVLRNMRTISSTEAARSFGDCLARVKHTGESLLICRNNAPVAVLSPAPGTGRMTVREFVELWNRLPFDNEFADDLERVRREYQALENPWDS